MCATVFTTNAAIAYTSAYHFRVHRVPLDRGSGIKGMQFLAILHLPKQIQFSSSIFTHSLAHTPAEG